MAKRKNSGVDLTPTLLDISSFSSNSIGDANIDTAGYDPTWDEPYLGQPAHAIASNLEPASNPDVVEELDDKSRHSSPGHPLSFGKTLDALLSGGKSVTRRKWENSYAQHFIKRYDRALPVRAFDRDQRYGGQQIGWLRLTQKPYQERLGDMPEADLIAEGFPELTKTKFIDRFFEGDADLTVWVVRFKFMPLEVEPSPVQELLSPSANEETAPESVSPAVEEPASVAVEVMPEVDPIADDELSYDEERDRLHLERKVERAFYEAGKALRELRDRRLYRSTHPTFEGYCRDRFGFTHRRINYMIAGSQVVENLQMGTIGSQTQENEKMGTIGSQIQNGTQGESLPDRERGTNGAQTEMLTNGLQILPTNERQVRSLVQLEPDQQREVWQQAVTEAGGKVPSGRIVKDIVERMQQVESPPQSPTRAHHLTLEAGGLVEVRCPGNEKIHCRHGRIASVREKTVEVWVRDTETMLMVKHTLKHQQVEVVAMENEPGLRELCDRIDRLRGRSLDPFDREILELLERAVVLTPREVEHLEGIEGRVL